MSSFITAMENAILKIYIEKIHILIMRMPTIIMILKPMKYYYLNKVTMNILLGIVI